jgi:hypothetical protein
MRSACLVALAVLFSAAAPAPQATLPVASAPAPEDSVIEIPVRASLAPLITEVEKQVPKRLEKLDSFEMDPRNLFGIRYRVLRDPVRIYMQNFGLHATTTVHFGIEGCKRVVNPINGAATMWPCVSCGFSETPREALITLDSRLEWDAQWRIRSITKARPVEFPRPCTVTLLNIDLSEWKIGPMVDQQMRDVVKAIDRDTPKLTSLRATAQQVWTSLQTPSELAPRTWLVFEPVDVALAPLRGSGQLVTSTLSLRARTRVVVGDRPAATARPLPPLRVAEPTGAGIRVPLDIELPYPEAGRLLTEQFGKRTYKVEGRDLIVDTLSLSPSSTGKVVLEAMIDYRGGTFRSYRGSVFFEGTPTYDAATSSVVIADLDYTIDKRRHNPFLRIAERVVHETLRTRLRQNARWPIAAEIASMRAEVERAMTRALAPNVTMRGRVASIAPTAVIPHSAGITIRVLAAGGGEVEVR